MERIQFYPPEELKIVMQQEADLKGISISQLSVDILMNYYGLTVSATNKKDLSEIMDVIFEEVKQYVNEIKAAKGNNSEITFDLLTASSTFKNIHMVANGKPSTNRATVGKVFVSKLGEGDFKNVEIARTESGAVKKSVNRAVMYKIK